MLTDFVLNFDENHTFSFIYGLCTFATVLLGCIFIIKSNERSYDRGIKDYKVIKHQKRLIIGLILIVLSIVVFFSYLNFKSDILKEHKEQSFNLLENFKTEKIALTDVVELYEVNKQYCSSNSTIHRCFYMESFSDKGLIKFYVMAQAEDFILKNQHNLYIDKYVIPEKHKNNYLGEIAKDIYID